MSSEKIVVKENNTGIISASGDRPAPALVYLASLQSPKSRETMRYALERVLKIMRAETTIDLFPWHQLKYEHVTAIKTALGAKYPPATANQTIAALKGTLKSAWRIGLLSGEEYHRASDIKGVKGHREARGRHISPGEIRQLFEAASRAKDHWLGARDAALIAVLFGAGLRRSEAANLDFANIDMEMGKIILLGKGNKERTTYLPPGSIDAVKNWFEIRTRIDEPETRGRRVNSESIETDAVFLSGKHGSNHRRMSDGGILYALNKIAKRAGVKQFSPHDLRRTFIGELLDAGADITSIQKMVGHESPTTTSRYDRRGDRAKQKSATLLHVPFVEKKNE